LAILCRLHSVEFSPAGPVSIMWVLMMGMDSASEPMVHPKYLIRIPTRKVFTSWTAEPWMWS